MERKLFLSICLILVLGQLYGCNSCIENERKALLELKKYIIPKIDEAYRDDVLLTWTNDTKSDCCRWKGVECNRTNGHVTGLSVSEMVFKEYILLNLSLLHPFEAVRSLNLSSKPYYNRFIGFFDDVEGYKSLKRLRNLEILDLSYNYFNQSILPFLNAATSLTTLHLNANFMGGVFRIKELNNLTNLELLDLGQNSFDGSIPELKTLTNLKLLNLGGNRLNGSISALMNLTKLELLSLAENSFSGLITVVCELKNLRELNLRENNFVGQLPLCLGSLKNLRVLDLSSNQLSGNLPSSFSNLESLEYLSLLDQNFTGLLSLSPLANLTKLKVFKLSSTSDMVRVETESTWQPKFHLSVVVLRFCKLEKIPSFLVYQKNLRLIDLSGNRLSGNIPTSLLANLPELEVLLLQNNLFTIFQMPTIVHNLKGLDISANDIHYKKQANLRGRF